MSQSDSAKQDAPEQAAVLTHPSSHASKKVQKPAARPAKPKPAAPVNKPERYLPTERITFRRQLDLLRGYAAATQDGAKPVTNKEVAAFVEMTESTASIANAFFIQNGFLTKGASGLVPSSEVILFKRAYQWDAATAAHKLAPLVSRSWFGQALLPRLSMNPLDEERAIQVLAEAANADTKYKANLRILLEYLEASGMIAREGTQIRAVRGTPDVAAHAEEDTMPASTTMEPAVQVETPPLPRVAGVQTDYNALASGVIQFNINVRVDLKEISGWRPDRIAAFFSGIAQVVAAKGNLEKTSTEG